MSRMDKVFHGGVRADGPVDTSTRYRAAEFEGISPRRIGALAELTELIESREQFCYLRMGDGEFRFLLSVQQGHASVPRTPEYASIELSRGDPGLGPEQGGRLLKSYEQCDYLDWYWSNEYVRKHSPELVFRGKPDQIRKDSIEETKLLTDWTWFEFPRYIQRHRVVICGAEAALLRELLKEPDYRRIAGRFFDQVAGCEFVQPSGDGRNLGENLEQIKTQIATAIRKSGSDTAFISLGGAAKIIGQELAQELRIRAFDFGSMLRSLTYSGSAGQALCRTDHLSYFFRVPFRTYMRAYQRAFPQAAPSNVLLKAQCQICLELQRKRPRFDTSSDAIDLRNYDPAPENLALFYKAYADYRRHYRWRGLLSRAGVRLLFGFEWWVVKKRLGWKGRTFGFLLRLRRRLIPMEV
jgi:hypothetical protein